MTIKLRIAVQSHLSDAAYEMEVNPTLAQIRIQFVKRLIAKYPDLSIEIEEDELNELWYDANFEVNHQ